jgi:putative mycofactocin binding protein MftB
MTFDLDRAWRVDPRVSMRPEPFGALLYHFGTRRLSFLKNQTVLAVVRSLADHPSARAACLASGVTEAELPVYARALGALADSQMISERTNPPFSACAIADQRDSQYQKKEDSPHDSRA